MMAGIDKDRVTRAAALLAKARRENLKLDTLPADAKPSSERESLAIQDEVTRLLSWPIGGWKVGLTPNVRLTYAPLYGPTIYSSPAALRASDYSSMIVEAEVAFRLGRDLHARDKPYTDADVADAVESALAAIEIGDPRLKDFMPSSWDYKLADNMGSGAMIHGSGTRSWQGLDRANLPVSVEVDGRKVVEKTGGNSAGDPFLALVALVEKMRSAGGLKAGQIVITGSVTGTYQGRRGSNVTIRFAGLGEASVKFE